MGKKSPASHHCQAGLLKLAVDCEGLPEHVKDTDSTERPPPLSAFCHMVEFTFSKVGSGGFASAGSPSSP